MAPEAPRDEPMPSERASLAAEPFTLLVDEFEGDEVVGLFVSFATVCGKRILDIRTCEVKEEHKPAGKCSGAVA